VADLVAESGLVIVDKPGGMTSHDVVARIRRLAGTRRVGHAGTLDPMATGVLVVGVEKATRLLGHLALTEKEYAATIRLGHSTDTDDADGDVLPPASPVRPVSGVSEQKLRAALAGFEGEISQVPPQISAIKVSGQRAYRLSRSGAAPELSARPVTISRLDLLATRPAGDGLLDVDVAVTCSSGTYIRAIARDLGAVLGTGGHLVALRRRRVGPYLIGEARTLGQLAARFEYTPLAQAAAEAFGSVQLSADEARLVSHGARLPAAVLAGHDTPAATARAADAPVAAFAPDGTLTALLVSRGGELRSLAVFAP